MDVASDEEIERLSVDVAFNFSGLLPSNLIDIIVDVRGERPVKKPKITLYVELVQELYRRFKKVEFKYVPRIQNKFADALATISSMIQNLEQSYINSLEISLKKQHAHYAQVEEQPDGKPWYFDIRRYFEAGAYFEDATVNQKKMIRRMANNFFLNGEVLYRRTLDLGFLQCADSIEATKLLEEIHAKMYGPHMNGFTLTKNILRAGYF
ncbi:uncharacterized protein LOC124896214 [Capsicum annuum]|uniref:uncharacterized protein LOC124896214 n=1 Tax=Capsicum annuum TaxID=4072 RepID=UPI001FB08E9A|nr:uncharacterized protein LOC124896214 [Capsicum annuum]